MKAATALLFLFLLSRDVLADTQQVSRARASLQELQTLTTELAKESARDAEVLRLLSDAARSLEDWQTNAAYSQAVDDVGKAEQLIGRPPAVNPTLRQAVTAAREVIESIKDDPSAADWAVVRTTFHNRALDPAREVVSEEMHSLATLAVYVSDVIADLTEALADGSSAAWARPR